MIQRLHQIFWVSILVIYPLAYNPYRYPVGQEVYLHPKAILLSLLVLYGLMVLLVSYPQLRLTQLPRQIIRAPKAIAAMIVFVIYLAVSGALVDYEISGVTWIGSNQRLDGVLIQMAWYFLFVIGFALAQSNYVRLSRILSLAVMGACLTSLVFLLEAYGHSLAMYIVPNIVSVNEPLAPLGNEAFIAGYLAVVLASLIVYRSGLGLSGRGAFVSVAAAGLLFAGVVATGNRASLVALLAVVLGFFALSFVWRRRETPARWPYLATLAVVLSLVSLVVVTTREQEYQVSSLLRAVGGEDSSTSIRLMAWRAGLQISAEHPLFGLGPNGFHKTVWGYLTLEEQNRIINGRIPESAVDYRVPAFSPNIEYLLPGDQEYRTRLMPLDKAHNYFLDLSVTSGFVGLALFLLSMALALGRMAVSTSRMAHAVAAGLLVYLIFGIAWFATLAVDPVVWAFAGVGLAAALRDDPVATGGRTEEPTCTVSQDS
ncbi:MAG: O-antigen ligase family protein [Trueperaceae bacterium]|nr:O-antigen ligase family protein [Trueperaceae bacterium]